MKLIVVFVVAAASVIFMLLFVMVRTGGNPIAYSYILYPLARHTSGPQVMAALDPML